MKKLKLKFKGEEGFFPILIGVVVAVVALGVVGYIGYRQFSSGTQPIVDRPGPEYVESSGSNAEKIDKSNLIYLEPSRGSIYKTGDKVMITLHLPENAAVEGVLFIVGDKLHTIKGAGPYSFELQIPKQFSIGVIDIIADSFGPNKNVSASTAIKIIPAESPLELSSEPNILYINSVPESYPLLILGKLSDGSYVDLTKSESGIRYSTKSQSNKIISVDDNGLVTAHAEGEDSVVVGYNDNQIIVPVNVELNKY